ncbi:hypothetical protein A8B78_01340 [Jannaschia sp. EhC01]|nr:hypothetical protein A8B78_01340 [Jannaschia sp. EhC01]
MNRFFLPLIAMAFASPVAAQTTETADWAGAYYGLQIGFPLDSAFTRDAFPGVELTLEGMSGGAQIGFRRQSDAFVYGGEIEFLTGEQTLVQTGFPDVDVRTTTTRLGGQAGYAFGRFLPYGTAGVARMTFQNTVGFGDTASFGTFAGLGFEYRLGEVTSLGFEAVRESFSAFDEGNDANVTETNLSAQINFHF